MQAEQFNKSAESVKSGSELTAASRLLEASTAGNEASLIRSDKLGSSDSLSLKLQREAEVMLGGALQGLGQTALKRLSESPGSTALEAASSFALGWGFVRLASSSFAPVRYAMPVVSAALSYSFIANLAGNLKQQSGQLTDAWQNTWQKSDVDLSAQRQKVADAVGPFLFDTSLTMASGSLGGKLAANGIENRATLNYMQEKYGDRIKEGIFKIGSEKQADGLRMMGTSFAVEKDRLATAFHVVQDQPGGKWTFGNSTSKGEARVIAGLPQQDLALLEVKEGVVKQVLPVAKSLDMLPQRGVLVGAPWGNALQAKPAMLQEGGGITQNAFIDDIGPKENVFMTKSVTGGRAWPGMSGGPAIAENGEVVGVLSSISSFLNFFKIGTTAIPARSLTYFEAMVQRAAQPGASMTLGEASQTLQMSPQNIIKQVGAGKLHGFLVPSAENAHQWRWLILRPSK